MLLIPDIIFENLTDITAEVLTAEGIKGLILDIDYTLAPKTAEVPGDDVIEYINRLKQHNIKLYLISNNHKERVSKFATPLGLPYLCDSFKPFPRAFLKAIGEMGLEKSAVAAVGDQIYTDVCGGHLAGIRVFMLLPTQERTSLPYKLRHQFEKPFIGRYFKNEKKRKA